MYLHTPHKDLPYLPAICLVFDVAYMLGVLSKWRRTLLATYGHGILGLPYGEPRA